MTHKIPSYYIDVMEDDLNILRNDIKADHQVPAMLRIGDMTYESKLSYRGSYTRGFRKRPYLIQLIKPDRFQGARELHLNAEYKDPSLLRNKLSLDFFQDIGVLSPNSKHINLYRNETLKGVYLHLESVDDLFLEKRELPLGPIYYAVNNNANFSFTRDGKEKKSLLSGYRRKIGDNTDDKFLEKLIKMINTTTDSEFEREIPKFIDIEKYLLWKAGAICTMNNDGFTHNYALYRNPKTKLFEIMPWDYDATWGRKVDGGVMGYDYVPIEGKEGNYLSYRLLEISDFRKQYKNILEELLETKFTVDYMDSKVMSLYKTIRPHVAVDPYKKKKMDIFDQEPEFIFQFIRDRSCFIQDRLDYLS